MVTKPCFSTCPRTDCAIFFECGEHWGFTKHYTAPQFTTILEDINKAMVRKLSLRPRIVPAKDYHIPPIAANIREADRQEMWDYAMLHPVDALEKSLAISAKAWTGLIGEEPVCMFGVATASLLSGMGRPWMIGTSELDRNHMIFLRRCKPVVEEMQNMYGRLENYVQKTNVRAIQWLRWLGFKFGETQPMGARGKAFVRFYWER